ncbi:probable peroxiredoxin [Thermoplasma acidophilum]|uniref:Probable peroxiredoxin n=1 Tax=Thermoplasma acidophilum (strain ATCC 25905 / DSM 1728 / JCM 9062 / NBRC 15155 / AMRC-C165) TaxID=273075 RepID=Q9HLS3_THEAC|nr:peroxiredoxin [Thermoplasma acidophilum]MCY0851616.1 peroxiredoxin [Thermoplasma acidophilum]CAC11299.1 probable peroxiredoxin [Thermoplasma acidophilum]
MSLVNKAAPDFEANAFVNGQIKKVRLSSYRGKWVVLFFYPADFTFVCPTEVEGFAEDYEKFKKKNTEVISVSADTVYVHQAWVQHDERVAKAKFPMVEDRKGTIARAYDVYNEETGNAQRGLFIINPDGIVKYVVITDDNVGRSTDETLRVLEALQSGGLCPVNWHEGEPTIKV